MSTLKNEGEILNKNFGGVLLKIRIKCDTSLVFCRKDLCEVKHETQSVFKFADVLFALKSDIPPGRGIYFQEQYYIRSA